MKSQIWKFGTVAMLALAVAGCHPKAQVTQPPPEQPPKTTQETPPQKPPEEPSLRGKDYQEVAALQTIFFDLDQSTLRSDARDTLQKNYEELSKHADWEVLVEGHCDERGTTEYNLGLGQKRAAAVRQYYMTLGIDGARVATISYGKEKPECSEHTEECWAKNRRGVTKVRVNPAAEGGDNSNSSSGGSDAGSPPPAAGTAQ